MFFEVFAASALATVLFGARPSDMKDYSQDFNRLNSRFDSVDKKLDTLIDNSAFMRARACLMEFSPKLLNNVKIGKNCYKVETIMEAAAEGFNMLLDAALADENNFKDARRIFNETFGNIKWVREKYQAECDEFLEKTQFINNYIATMQQDIDNHVMEFDKLINAMKSQMPKGIYKLFKMNKFIETWKSQYKEFFANDNLQNYATTEFKELYFEIKHENFSIRDFIYKAFDTHNITFNVSCFYEYLKSYYELLEHANVIANLKTDNMKTLYEKIYKERIEEMNKICAIKFKNILNDRAI